MLKISQAGKANHSVTLKLEGRVVGPWVGELRQVCETLLTEGRAAVEILRLGWTRARLGSS